MPKAKGKQTKEARTVYHARRAPAKRRPKPDDVAARWSEIEAAAEPIILKRNGQPVAVVVSYADYLRLENARKEQAAVPMEAIQKIVDVIAEKFNPDKIILFGSYAYGLPRRGSDVDLLVVMETDDMNDAAFQVRRVLPLRDFGLDLIVRPKAEIERRLAMGDRFIKDVTTLGKVLYARDSNGVGSES